MVPALLFLAVFYAWPLVAILATSFARAPQGVWVLVWETFTRPAVWGVLGFTFYQATLSTLLTLAVGLPSAYVFARYRFPGQTLLRALTAIPFVLPTLVVAAAFNALLGPRGWVNLGLGALGLPPVQLLNTFTIILLAHVFYNLTIVIRVVGDFWQRLDPRLVAAAQTLGANRWRAFWHVTLPLLTPAILSAALLVFLFDFTSFGVVLVLGGPQFATLEVEIYRQTLERFNLPLAALLALLQLGCTLLITAIQAHLSQRLSATVHQRPPVLRSPTSTRARLGLAFILALLIVLQFTPLLALFTRSFARLEAERGERGTVSYGFTLDYYWELGINRRDSLFFVPPLTAITNSLTIASITVVLALALGLPAAWALARGQGAWVEALLMLPLGTSAVTLGLGFIVALNRPPLDLRTSPWLLPLAHTLVALPFVVRSLTPALRALRPRLRQAAAMLGASPWQAWRAVELPIVGRAVLVAATFAFMLSLGEFGATALLTRPDQPTIPIVIYSYLSLPGALNYGQALALSTLLAIVCAAGILLMERFQVEG